MTEKVSNLSILWDRINITVMVPLVWSIADHTRCPEGGAPLVLASTAIARVQCFGMLVMPAGATKDTRGILTSSMAAPLMKVIFHITKLMQ